MVWKFLWGIKILHRHRHTHLSPFCSISLRKTGTRLINGLVDMQMSHSANCNTDRSRPQGRTMMQLEGRINRRIYSSNPKWIRARDLPGFGVTCQSSWSYLKLLVNPTKSKEHKEKTYITSFSLLFIGLTNTINAKGLWYNLRKMRIGRLHFIHG